METTDAATPLFVSGVLAIWGILDCFFGYRIFRYTITALGIICGAIAGWALGTSFIPDPNWVPPALAVGGAIGGAILAWRLFQLALALVASVGAGMIVSTFLNREDGLIYWALICVAALVAALLTIFMVRAMIVLVTAFTGSFRFVVGTSALLGLIAAIDLRDDPLVWIETVANSPWMLSGVLILGGLGALFQLIEPWPRGARAGRE